MDDTEVLAASGLRARTLVVLDVNGFMVERAKTGDNPDAYTKKKYMVWIRPHIREFVVNLMLRFDVAIWSSARRDNLMEVLELVFEPAILERCVFIFDQSFCEDGKKDLRRVWDWFPQYKGRTVLVDDTPEKCVQPALNPRTWTRGMVNDDLYDLLNHI